MKLLRQDDGYSYYENPDAELVEKIKNHPKPTQISNWELSNDRALWSFKEVLKNGKILMESEGGDLKSIPKDTYDEISLEEHLESINRTFLVSETFNKYFAPIKRGTSIIYSMTDEHLVLPMRTESFYSGVNSVFNEEEWGINDYKGLEYKQSFNNGNGHMYFTENGEIANRDYNHNFNITPPYVSKEATIAEFCLKLVKKLPTTLEMAEGGSVYFTDRFAIRYNANHEWYETTLEVEFIPFVSGNNYYHSGESYRKVVKPKKNLITIESSELIQLIKNELDKFITERTTLHQEKVI